MEKKGRGPWNIYGTPVKVEKSTFARAGLRSLRVVTDNKGTMGGNYEGTSRFLGKFRPGDEIRISFWYWVKGGKKIVVGMGPTHFENRWVLSGTDWTRAQVSLRCTKATRYNIWISQAADATEFFLDDFAMEIVRRPDLGMAKKAQRTELRGGPLRLTLCRQTGALCGIENTATGETYAPVGQRQPLFGLELLSKDGAGYERVPFGKAKLRSFRSDSPKKAKLDFETAGLPVQITVEIKMSDDGAAHFTGRLRNGSKRNILSFEMPMVYGVRPAENAADLTLVDPHVCGRIIPNAAASSGCQTTYPGRGVMGWMDLSGKKGGIYLATHDKSSTGTLLAAVPAPGPTFDMSLTKQIVVKPGKTWHCPEAVLAVHDGDWHASADRYRAWARSWMKKPDLPQWIRDANGWVLMGCQNGVPFRRIPDVFRQAQWMGIEYLHVHGEGIDSTWQDKSGKHHARCSPTYLYPSPAFGTVAELKAAVRKVHEAEGRVMFYFLYERWTPSHSTSDNFGGGKRSEVPKEYLPPPLAFYYNNALLDNPGRKPPTKHPFMAERNMCLASAGWQDWMRRWAIDVYAKQLGADGFYWDVMGRNGPFRCFNGKHGHEGQNGWAGGCAKVLETVIREGRKVNPDYSCAIEGCSDVLGQWVGFHLMSGATKHPNVFRYTFPEYICVDGFSNTFWKLTRPQKAHRVFLNGERFDIHGYDQRVKRIINLRRRIKPFTDWPAVFRDTVGLKTSDKRVQARAFVRTDGENRVIAVTMMNEQHVKDATVKVDLKPIGRPKAAYLFHLDGRVSVAGKPGAGVQIINVPRDNVSAAVIVSALSPQLSAVSWLEQIMTPGEDGAVLSIFMPLGKVKDLSWRVNWPKGLRPAEEALVGGADYFQKITFRDRARLRALKRWTKTKAQVTWRGGKSKAWAVLAPPLVNGGFEEIEDGFLVYWGVSPENKDPGQGKYCIRLDKETAPLRHIRQLTPLKPNCKYRFKCMVKRTGQKWAGAHIVEYQEGQKFLRSAALNSKKIGKWERLETTFTTHPNPRSTAIYLYNYDDKSPAYFDDVQLEEMK